MTNQNELSSTLQNIVDNTNNLNKLNTKMTRVEVLDATPENKAETQENFLFSSMAFSGNKPVWGGDIGNVMPENVTPTDSLKYGGLNFSVEKEKIYLQNSNLIPKHFAVVRKDTGIVLAIVGKDYEVLQNTVLVDIANSFIDFGASVSTCGSIKKGRLCWMLLKLDDDIVLKDNDRVEKYIVITTSHDGTTPVTAFCSPLRVCCSNTLNMAIRGAKNSFKIKIKHTAEATVKLKQAKKMFADVDNYFDKFEAMSLALQDTTFTVKQMEKLAAIMHPLPKKKEKPNEEVLADLAAGKNVLTEMVSNATSEAKVIDSLLNKEEIKVPRRTQKQREELVKLFETGTGNSGKTAFDAINAITEGKQHNEILANYKNTDNSTSSENRFSSVMSGNAKQYADKAINEILEMVSLEKTSW